MTYVLKIMLKKVGSKMTKEIKLTKEEKEIFSNFEQHIIFANGLKWANGAYAEIEPFLIAHNENDDECVCCKVTCGTHDDCLHQRTTWEVTYNRKTKKFQGDIDDE